jgi:signal transduction histidine kinase
MGSSENNIEMNTVKHKITVLLVDDQQMIGEAVRRMLAEEKDISFHYCQDPARAIQTANEISPTVILQDLVMPEINGLTLVKFFRANPSTKNVPLIVLSSKEEPEIKAAAFAIDANDYLVKLPDKLELIARIRYHSMGYINMIERDEAFEALQKSQQELLQTNKMLEKVNLELQENRNQLVQSEKLASIGQLAAGVAHEINNPVGFVKSNISTLSSYLEILKDIFQRYRMLSDQKDLKSEDIFQQFEEIEAYARSKKIDYILDDLEPLLKESLEGTERVREIVSNLKIFARPDEIDLKEVDLYEGLENSLKIIWNELKYKCEVIKNFKPLPLIQCHPGQINQVFINILLNAANAIAEKGTITIESYSDPTTVGIKISDTGCGISPENINKIFDPFFTTRDVGKGTGLGLSVSHGIIDKHKGKIEVKSELGKGTSFTILLPIKQPQE